MPDLPATRLTPALLPVGGSISDVLEHPEDRDWVGLDLVAGQTVEITLEGTGGGLNDTVMMLHNPRGGELVGNDDYRGALSSGLIYTAVETGRHYVQVASFNGEEAGNWRMTARAAEAPGPLEAIDWGDQFEDPRITVYFVPAGDQVYDINTREFMTSEGFNAYERARFQEAFDRLEAVTDLQFDIVNDPNADFRLVLDLDQIQGEYLAYFNPPGEDGAGIGVFDGSSWDRSAGGDLEVGGEAFAIITHEVLHGLGLAHPHDTGGTSMRMAGVTSEFGDYGDHDLNQGVFTTMSYNTGYWTGGAALQPAGSGNWGYEAGPMALDVALLQQKYGANTEHNTGNDIYVLDGTNGAGTGWEVLWDAGGYDELRAPDNQDAIIDLRRPTLASDSGGGGHISQVEGVAGGYVVAAGVVIEVARGGGGDDTLYGNFAANVLRGGGGADRMNGGYGNDFYFVDNPGDQIFGEVGYSQGGGIDTVRTFIDYVQPTNIELVRLGNVNGTKNLNAIGNDAPGVLVGNAGDNSLTGRGGNDVLKGNDGDDWIIGNTGRDSLAGGAGSDTFVYTSISESRAGGDNRDFINGFERGSDVIDLSGIDANLGRPGEGAFAFIGTARFSGTAGELRLLDLGGANAVVVEADVRGDGVADLQIFVRFARLLDESDFIL